MRSFKGLSIAAALLTACACSAAEYINVGATQWTEANSFFKKDPHWQGADGAYTVKLEHGRVLWLFGDTIIADKKRSKDDFKMPRNTVGIQEGSNPLTASIKYYWNKNNDLQNPESFFVSPYINKNNWLWISDGTLLPDKKTLVVFLMNIMPTETGLHFDIDGYQVAVIRNIEDTPDKWDIRYVEKVSSYLPWKVMLGGSIITEGDYLYAYGYCSNSGLSQEVCLARWDLKEFRNETPDLSNPEWWVGKDSGWVKQSDLGQKTPAAVWNKGQTEFSVKKIGGDAPGQSFYVMFETYPQNGFIGNADMTFRVARELSGPWSDQYAIYIKLFEDTPCPDDIMVYAGKYHPELKGSEIILTYATNTLSVDSLWNYDAVYYPRFLKIDNTAIISILREKLPK